MALVFLNGQFLPESQAMVSVFDRGFLYGDGLFETIRAFNYKLFLWEQHIRRLQSGLTLLRVQIPFSEAQLGEAATTLLEKNSLPDAIVRINISRGVGARGYSPKSANSPSVVISTHPVDPLSRDHPPLWRIVTTSFTLSPNDPLSAIKSTNKLPQILARAEADDLDANEALLQTRSGSLAEGTTTNLFWIKDQTVHTTPTECGILPGVTRDFILQLCHSLKIKTAQSEITKEDLLRTDGVFLTSTGIGIAEASHLDGQPLPRSALTQTLYHTYVASVGEIISMRPAL
jgi:aminodeoxychorismate lyase